MNNLPKISVIIPLYNRGNFIAQTIQSVLNQTYPNIELIVVDDGSTDNSRNVLKQFEGKIRILEHPGRVNKGQSAAINLGIKSSESKYVAILDSDDLFAPEKIQLQVEYLEKNPHVGLVYGNGYAINEQGKKIYPIYKDGHRENSAPERVLMDCYFLLPNNSLIRRKVLDEVGDFDESLRSAQDHDMAIRVAEVTKLAYLKKELFYYRRHGNSISAKNASLRWNNGFIILDKARRRFKYSSSVVRRRRAVLHFRVGQCLLEEKKISRALWHFICSGLLDPYRALQVTLGREAVTGPH
ncbi:MAG: glycosyltransferase [Candidatus Electrothrix sp. AX5]|nr:glycosyltransferase [Candidatus Electrothrix sp. AX5]